MDQFDELLGGIPIIDTEDAGPSGQVNGIRRSTRQNLGKNPDWLIEFVGSKTKKVTKPNEAVMEELSTLDKDKEVGENLGNVPAAPSVIHSNRSKNSAISTASKIKMREQIELDRLKKLHEMEEEERRIKLAERKALLEQETKLRIAELNELDQNSESEDDGIDFASVINTKNKENVVKRTQDWIISQNETKTVNNEDKIGEALLMIAKLQAETSKRDDLKLFMTRQVALTPLREFSGRSEEWQGFLQDYKTSTEMCGLSNEENMKRLCKCLRGKAKDLFLGKLTSAEQVPKVLEQMEEMFGNPRIIIQSMIKNLREMPFVRGDKPETLINFAHGVDSLVNTMKVLKNTGHLENPQLIDEIINKLPLALKMKWAELILEKNSNTNLIELAEWLCKRAKIANVLRNIDNDNNENCDKPKRVENSSGREWKHIPTTSGLVNSSNPKTRRICCIFCEKEHESWKCLNAAKMTSDEKKNCVIKHRVCFACLKYGHSAKDCRSNIACPICNKKHLKVMCFTKNTAEEIVKKDNIEKTSTVKRDDKEKTENPNDLTLGNMTTTPEVLLQTVLVTVRGTDDSKRKNVRALLDTGSQRSYISKQLAHEMKYIAVGEETISHGLFGGSEIIGQKHSTYRVRVSALNSENVYCFITLDQEDICGNISKVPNGPWMKELNEMGIILTDNDNRAQKIDMMLGADVIGKLYSGDVRNLKSGPVAVGTHLGWTLMGKLPTMKSKYDHNLFVSNLHYGDNELQNLWKLETIGITDPIEIKTKEEVNKDTMDLFCKTVKTNAEGRYEVILPWKNGHNDLPTNRKLAEKRLFNATKKLISLDVLKSYDQVFREWQEEGVIEEVPTEEIQNYGHYLPHRAVVKMSSETTKIRPVFDASAHESKSPSLNDCLQKGENLLELIPDVLTRFRLNRVGVTADIKKAFLQISIKPSDRDYCRFLWWKNPEQFNANENNEKNLKIFRHCRVPFGLKPSPFLLGATINFHLDTVSDEWKESAVLLKKSFYVDNCVTSLPSEKACNKFMDDCKKLMNSAKFDLRGWIWNGSQSIDENVPVLGLMWDTTDDTLRCDVKESGGELHPVTKRKILSVANSVFDPIGFTSPATLLPKTLLQSTWELKLNWDEELPKEIAKQFTNWVNSLKLLNKIKIPRWYFKTEFVPENCSLHVFTDASKIAYAACIFLREEIEDEVSLQLVAAKTRITPVKLKTFTPRLELLGCVIGARLSMAVKKSLDFLDIPTTYWSDSSNALYWIKKEDQWDTFVMNRVCEIRKLTDKEKWNHIAGPLNPADLPSRGCSVQNLIESSWWEGPAWLKEKEALWPKCEIDFDEDIVNSERKKASMNLAAVAIQEKFSDILLNTKYEVTYRKVLKIVIWIFRFTKNCRLKKEDRETGSLSSSELEKAELALVRVVQNETFLHDVTLLKGVRSFKDENGIIRVKTKISRREDIYNFKYPAILPPDHNIVKLLITDKHKQMSHAGIQVMMCALRENFWIIHSRKTIRKMIRKCMTCKKFDAKALHSEPAPLPLDRVKDANVFEITGLDMAGPLFLKNRKKVWICIFTCAVYRAIHLELVSSLSTDSFLQALRRFVSRRGRPSIVYSDNGTNFKGARNALEDLDWKKIEAYSTVQRIQWKFNPPTAAWWGGFWERLIRMVKENLRKVIGKACLNSEELHTFLCETENLVNRRPLTYVSEDTDDLCPLTPAMFLMEISEDGLPDLDVLDGEYLNKRINYRKKVREDLRQRFRKEYLGLLLQQGGQGRKITTVQPGDIVIIGNDNEKRIDWSLGRILETFPGRDGFVRVVRLHTSSGEVSRPIQRIYPLEISLDEGKDLISKVKQYPVTKSGRSVIPPQRLNMES